MQVSFELNLTLRVNSAQAHTSFFFIIVCSQISISWFLFPPCDRFTLSYLIWRYSFGVKIDRKGNPISFSRGIRSNTSIPSFIKAIFFSIAHFLSDAKTCEIDLRGVMIHFLFTISIRGPLFFFLLNFFKAGQNFFFSS